MSTATAARPAPPRPSALRPTRAWRVALRLGARDARRHPARTAVALLMIGLPVAAAAALATLLPTLVIDGAAAATARMGQAAGVVTDGGYDEAEQFPGGSSAGGSDDGRDLYTEAEVVEIVGAPVTRVLTRHGVPAGADGTLVTVTETDTAAPVTRGMYTVRDGRLPQAADEVALNPVAADALDATVGDRTEVAGQLLTVVGTAHPAYGLEQSMDRPWALAVTGSLLGEPQVTFDRPGGDDHLQWLVGREEPLTAADVAVLNEAGLFGDSRDPDVLTGDATLLGPAAGETAVLLSVAVVLVLIEIALLAGPAFAVGVRTQRRTLAQLAATGADARALQQVVLGQALVIGVAAGLSGAVVGTAAVAGALAVLRATRDDFVTGPLDVSVVGLLLVLVAAVVAAVGAAAGPAASVARDDVALSLRESAGSRTVPGRRGLRGAALFATGTVVMVLAGTSGAGLAVGLLVTTVGVLLVVPLLVAALGPVSRHLPLPFRLAARDAARAAGRSVAAVAAVTGATAGLVAALTVTGSVDAYDAARYEPRLPPGVAEVSPSSYPPPAGWQDRLESVVAEVAPGAGVAYAGSVAEGDLGAPDGEWTTLFVPTVDVPSVPAGAEAGDPDLYRWSSTGGMRAAQPAAAALLPDLDAADLRWLAAGGALVRPDLVPDLATGPDGTLLLQRLRYGEPGEVAPERAVAVPVRAAPVAEGAVLVGADTADELGGFVPDRGYVLGARVDQEAAERLGAVVVDPTSPQVGASVYVENGPTSRLGDGAALTVSLLAGLVLLAGALTATGLALSDARRDRVVLAAAGASPGVQRAVAGAVTVVVVLLGAAGGVVLGLVPGVVTAWRLTDSQLPDLGSLRDGVLVPGVELPWLAIGLLVLLVPWLLGALVAALARPVPDQEVTRLVSRV